MSTSPVIDLSHHNPTPDWQALKASGVIGAILKCTEGSDYVDPTYGQRANDATFAGLLTVPYHFLKHGNIKGQMEWFLGRAGVPDGGRVVLDHETDATLDELCQAVTILWQLRADLEITIYSGHTIKDQLPEGSSRPELENTSLWIAQYTDAASPSWPKTQWGAWSLWQWTDHEYFDGLNQPADGNRWNGSDEALVKFLTPTGSPIPAPPNPVDDVPTVAITVTGKCRVSVNGLVVSE